MKQPIRFVVGFLISLLPAFWVASRINNRSFPVCCIGACVMALGCGWLFMRLSGKGDDAKSTNPSRDSR